ncbi:dUTP diphosphatase [Candidatus Micrarchaeota archaeon]|nr:dUTP diphosphatase [Candidatus Micrarchaeota archaeon]
MGRIKVKVRIEEKAVGAALPMYMTEHSAGADLCAAVDKGLEIAPGDVAVVPTGIFLELPEGFEAQIRPRSGLALRYGITVLNTPGTIDSDYGREVKVVLINHGKNKFVVKKGDKIAQLVFAKVERAEFEVEGGQRPSFRLLII